MKIFFFTILILPFLYNCSFDNKTGIWTGDEKLTKKEKSLSNLKPVFKDNQNEFLEKDFSNKEDLSFGKVGNNLSWTQQYQNNANHIKRSNFSNIGSIEKFSKISRYNINNNILYKNDKLYYSDVKGNIGIYSLINNKELFKFNFYKKKFKNIDKKINIILKNNLIIAADNFGYIYCINYVEKKLIWAKNYLIPFRSNIKILDNFLFIIDEKNKVIKVDLKTGNKLDEIYTQPAKTVSSFNSNLSIDNSNNVLALTTNGTLYSLNLLNKKVINWIVNFKNEDEVTFQAKPIIVVDNDILISTKDKISVISTTGKKKWEIDLKITVNPIVSGKYILLVTDKNYLMFIDKDTGKIMYSQNIIKMLKNDTDKNYGKKIKKFEHLLLINNKVLIISESSYFIELTLGKRISISSVRKNPFQIISDIIFFKSNLLLVSDTKRIYKIN
tara:strand:+ start:2338 stop:3663 length:1326 start_codon:yes stop_codon:yes gene_type:complete